MMQHLSDQDCKKLDQIVRRYGDRRAEHERKVASMERELRRQALCVYCDMLAVFESRGFSQQQFDRVLAVITEGSAA